jgi:hypothetical protein
MNNQHRFRIIAVLTLVVIAGFVILGIPYGKFNWANSIIAAPYEDEPIVLPAGPNGQLPPLITITCDRTNLLDNPAGNVVVKDGTSLSVVGGSRWFMVGNPVADKSGTLWQAIFVGGPKYPFVPLNCIR